MNLTEKQLVELVLSSFEAEANSEVETNLKLVTDDFAFTDMIVSENGKPLPRLGGVKAKQLMHKAFQIKGRKFTYKNISANVTTQTVFVEFTEYYKDPENGSEYLTPQVAICEIKNGLIHRTRHYMDPRLSFLGLKNSDLDKAFE